MAQSKRLGSSYIRRTGATTRGATNTLVVIFSTAAESNGNDITYVNSAANGDSFLINTTGIYAVSVSFAASAASLVVEIRVGTLDNSSFDAKSRAGQTSAAGGSDSYSCSWIGPVSAGQSIWALSSANPSAGTYSEITIARIA